MYVDGFLLAVPKKNLAAYASMAKKAGKIWRELGALDYKECVSDDINVKFGIPFNKTAKLKAGEVAVFAWIVYKSKSERNIINAKIMKDPRMHKICPKVIPFDMKRMSYGGFKIIANV